MDNVYSTAARVGNPIGIWGDTAGSIFFVDGYNFKVRKYDTANQFVSTIAGTGSLPTGFVASGAAKSINLRAPDSVTGDTSGKLFVSDGSSQSFSNVVRGMFVSTALPSLQPTFLPSFEPTSAKPTTATPTLSLFPTPTPIDYTMTTVAGNGTAGMGGTYLAATNCQLRNPMAMFYDSAFAALYVVDSQNFVIRRVTSGKLFEKNSISDIKSLICSIFQVSLQCLSAL